MSASRTLFFSDSSCWEFISVAWLQSVVVRLSFSQLSSSFRSRSLCFVTGTITATPNCHSRKASRCSKSTVFWMTDSEIVATSFQTRLLPINFRGTVDWRRATANWRCPGGTLPLISLIASLTKSTMLAPGTRVPSIVTTPLASQTTLPLARKRYTSCLAFSLYLFGTV